MESFTKFSVESLFIRPPQPGKINEKKGSCDSNEPKMQTFG